MAGVAGYYNDFQTAVRVELEFRGTYWIIAFEAVETEK